jgi:hypothetical protein
MRKHIWTTLLGLAFLPGLALADEWKDESGHGKHRHDKRWGEHFGEPPAWERGKGYWDGHFRHPHPPAYGPGRFVPPSGYYPQYPPPVAYPPWRGDWDEEDYEDRWEDYRERLEDQREEEREAYEDWLEDRREHMKKLRKRQKEAYKHWR